MRRKKSSMIAFFIFIPIISLFACFKMTFSANASTSIFTKAVVKLYDGGNVVGQWETIDFGEISGNTLVFTTTEKTKVRICGTYSIQETR